MMGRFMAGFMVSAAWRSSGKTTVACGLAATLARRELAVQPFKKGPDFIDPQWLSVAAGRPCRNLDIHLQGALGVDEYWRRHAGSAEVALIEGNMGLHDGLALDGSDSNATLARRLGVPVVLVLDARGTGRGAAALLLGLAGFDPQVRIAGVILNRLGGARHEAKLRAAIEAYTPLEVLGAIGEDPKLAIVERHLGLVPANEAADAQARVRALADRIESGVNVAAILAAAAGASPLAEPAAQRSSAPPAGGPRIGIPRDRAFGFYYPDDLEALQEAGAVLVPFDTLADARLPDVDALFIGGGFPETLAAELEANAALRGEIRAAVERGLPVYAECGGLMYLARSITMGGRTHRMAGAIPADVVMHRKPVGKGYVTLAETTGHPWAGGGPVQAHEFHYSSLENVDPGVRYAYRVMRGHGIDGERDGLVHRNVLASYAHQRSVGGNDWARRFVAYVRRMKAAAAEVAAARPVEEEAQP
ncbi:MAG TPA: cobyrinate a,c-diamide synthase [Usitatibacter sp.]|nr:cobyrinate a,c-diamide synthase [Usitatibacter sp.]